MFIEVPILIEDNEDDYVSVINAVINLDNVLMYCPDAEDPENCTDIIFVSPILFGDGESKAITIYESYDKFTETISNSYR